VSDPAAKGLAAGAPAPAGATTTFMRRGAAWCEVAKLAEPIFRVRLGGLLRTSWMSALCNRLAESRVSIEHTHARLAHDKSWIAELHVFALADAADPLKLPYIEFMEAEAATPSGTRLDLRLDSYRLIESRDYGGTLMLTLEGPDTLGFLGALLASLGSLGLFPVEVHIETRGGRAYDCLWLAAADGALPPAGAKDALDQVLVSSLKATGSRI
jgi:hypothetical protein